MHIGLAKDILKLDNTSEKYMAWPAGFTSVIRWLTLEVWQFKRRHVILKS